MAWLHSKTYAMNFLEIDYFVIYVWYIYLIIAVKFIRLGYGVEKIT